MAVNDASQNPTPLRADKRRKAGHYEILGETYAKFEFFENGWNSYSRFLDADKVDLILRRNESGKVIYREIQVKFGKLYDVGPAWERKLFDVTSFRFFKEDEFAADVGRTDFFVAYVLAHDIGYDGDIFIFPVRTFVESLRCVRANNGQRRVLISRSKTEPDRWFLRRTGNKFDCINGETCLELSAYRRRFDILRPS